MMTRGSKGASARSLTNRIAMAADSFTLNRRIMRQTIEHRHPMEADQHAELEAATVAVERTAGSR
jgi:hypothetical protein